MSFTACRQPRLNSLVQGGNCQFYHRIPNDSDEKRLGLSVDIFGRERHRTDRDDMGGVGSFERNNKSTPAL
jgi:hypothetical protein